MKKYFTYQLLILLFISYTKLLSQNNVGVGTNTPNSEAKLDIRSTTQGLLIPRMSTTQRLALANETSSNRTANGMMVYDITLNRLMIYDSLANSGNGKWQALVLSDSINNVWKLTGNAGTNPATNFIGTTDSTNMILKTNNQKHTTFFADGSWLIGDSMQGGGTKAFFDASKGAFRTGGKELFGTSIVSWDKDSLGENSFACGTSSLAKGNYSMAIGGNSHAIGDHSFALGRLAHALGENSYAFGLSTSAIGIGSMSFGNSNFTYGGLSVAFGQSNRTNGIGSMAFGQTGITNGLYSYTFGKQSTSNADYSVAMGNRTKSNGFSSLVIGQYNDTIVARQTSISSTTPLFIIGNGTWDTSLSNAMIVRQDGNVGIGTNSPSEKIDINGKTKTSNFQMTSGAGAGKILQSDASGNASWVTSPSPSIDWSINGNTGTNPAINFIGTTDSINMILKTNNKKHTTFFADGSWLIGDSMQGAGVKTFFDAYKVSFRTGELLNSLAKRNWDKDSMGKYSFASGRDSKAKGEGSVALGIQTKAVGLVSTALGGNTSASGDFSTALGESTTASGDYSTAMGNYSIASGVYSTAMGEYARASGEYSIAMGSNTLANGNKSTALGGNTTANGENSTAIGYYSEANGDYSIAMGEVTISNSSNSTSMGYYSTANGVASTAIGNSTIANGSSSTAMGNSTIANGVASTAMGKSTKSNGFSSLVIGQYNDSIVAPQTTSTSTTPLFIIGNGTSPISRSNAMVVRQDGNVGIGINSPTCDLDVAGKTKTINFQMTTGAGTGKLLQSDASGNASWVTVPGASTDWRINGNAGTNPTTNFIGTIDSINMILKTNNQKHTTFFADGSWLIGDSMQGTGTKTFFDASKRAFRTGQVLNTITGRRNWDKDSIGFGSFASGIDTKAKGYASIANGYASIANGYSSIAMGNATTANVDFSTAMGYYSIANGLISTAIGDNSVANGRSSISMGTSTKSNGFSSLVIGQYNDSIVAPQTASTSSTPLFIIGNGTSTSSTSNAMVVRQDGNVGISTNTPTCELDVKGKIKTLNFQMTSGAALNEVLRSDATGNASWVALSTLETDPEVGTTTINAVPKWDGSQLVDGIITDNGTNIGISTSPSVKLHINGAIAIVPNTGIVVNADNFNITVGNESYIRLSGDGAASASRTITLSNGLAVGQILFIECTSNGVQIDDNTTTNNTNVNVAHTLASNDVIQLLWNGADWLEVSFSDN